MFDVYKTEVAAPYPQTVIEKRAPTDESVRLLREMEAEARARVIDAYVTRGNDLHGAVIRQRAAETDEIVVICRFDLNGRRHVVEERLDRVALDWDEHEARRRLFEAVARAIAARLLGVL